MVRPKVENPRTKTANIRLTEEERADIEQVAAAHGFCAKSITGGTRPNFRLRLNG